MFVCDQVKLVLMYFDVERTLGTRLKQIWNKMRPCKAPQSPCATFMMWLSRKKKQQQQQQQRGKQKKNEV